MLIPFYSILSKIKTDEVKKVLMDALKEKFQLLSDIENKHFNFDEIGKSLNEKITKNQMNKKYQKSQLKLEMVKQQKEISI